MDDTVLIKRLTAGSLFKLTLIGWMLTIVPFCALCGVLSLMGYGTVTLNNEPVTGVKGLLTSLALGPLLAFAGSCIQWLFMAGGLWVYSLFRPLTIQYVPVTPADLDQLIRNESQSIG